jgi:hypothetical protein
MTDRSRSEVPLDRASPLLPLPSSGLVFKICDDGLLTARGADLPDQDRDRILGHAPKCAHCMIALRDGAEIFVDVDGDHHLLSLHKGNPAVATDAHLLDGISGATQVAVSASSRAARFTEQATQRLPFDERGRYEQEWLADLAWTEGRWAQLRYALTLRFWTAPRLARQLSYGEKQRLAGAPSKAR